MAQNITKIVPPPIKTTQKNILNSNSSIAITSSEINNEIQADGLNEIKSPHPSGWI